MKYNLKKWRYPADLIREALSGEYAGLRFVACIFDFWICMLEYLEGMLKAKKKKATGNKVANNLKM